MNKKDSALLIVDVQNDFCGGGTLEVPGHEQIFTAINTVAPLFSTVVATRDWHPANHISFASAHDGAAIHDTISTSYGEQVLWPDHCVQGSHGAELHKQLDQKPLHMIIHKGTDPMRDSYSAFIESDGVSHTGLAGYLQARGVKQLFICGLATDFCVRATALDACKVLPSTIVITDAISAVDIPAGSGQNALKEMEQAGIRFCTSSEIITME